MQEGITIPEVGERLYVVNPYPNHPRHPKNPDGNFNHAHDRGLDLRNYPTRCFDGDIVMQGETVRVVEVTGDAVKLVLEQAPGVKDERSGGWKVPLERFTQIFGNGDLKLERRNEDEMSLERAREILAGVSASGALEIVGGTEGLVEELQMVTRRMVRKFDHEFAGNFVRPDLFVLYEAAVAIAKHHGVPVTSRDVLATGMVRRKIGEFMKTNQCVGDELPRLVEILTLIEHGDTVAWDPKDPVNNPLAVVVGDL
mgnify:CR=1 FL=1